MQTIRIRGAREHNLKNIDLELPKNKLVVITGPSGSGKSSLAFDTLYAEGQRRYVESLSAYARQFLELMPKPDVDSIEGLSPAVAIDQKTISKNPRSTVGTVTEIYDYLRLLYARVGVAHSPATGLPITAQTVSQMVDVVMQMPENSKIVILAPIVRGRKGEYKKELLELKKRGFARVYINGVMQSLDDPIKLNKTQKHNISVVIDRLVIGSPDIAQRVADSIEVALKTSEEGLLTILNVESKEEITLSEKFACPESGFSLTEIEPRLFSFNSPFGACKKCSGLGIETVFDVNKVVNMKASLRDGALRPWFHQRFQDYYLGILDALAAKLNFSMKVPFEELPQNIQDILLYGSKEQMKLIVKDDGQNYTMNKTFPGIMNFLQKRWQENERYREDLKDYQTITPCEICRGDRLKPEALCVKIAGLSIADVCKQSIEELIDWFSNLTLTAQQQVIGHKILNELKSRIGFLNQVGVGYLTLGRNAGTLSGGEGQRLRLASQIGSGLTGVLYVLDEPSIGLHQKDNDRLLESLKNLRNLGNTVVVVEHDEDAMLNADWLVDIGPGAGSKGGEIIAQGTPHEVKYNPKSITGQYLLGTRKIHLPKTRRPQDKKLVLKNACSHNLQNINVEFPLGNFICITGVSGSGKSTLIFEELLPKLQNQRIAGAEYIDKIISIDQSPIGRTPRSNPATYIGFFTIIREIFAELPEAKAMGYTLGRFSFNVKGGRCEACKGEGYLEIPMHFLPDVYVECDQCHGQRYNRETLYVRLKNKTIADVLNMTVDEALEFFAPYPGLREKIQLLQEVGLGYMSIGQSATTLSGGEAQRIKLAKELVKRSTGKTLYILDEPTTGLHFQDVDNLLNVLQRLVDAGNTMIVIEHNLDVIKTADWIIDLGPDGGNNGGKIVDCGAPETLSKGYTRLYLEPYLQERETAKKA